MGNWGGKFPGGPEEPFGRILNRDLFHFVLDVEVKRSRRYQNFLCLMLFKIKQFSQEGDRGGMEACYRKLGDLLMEETRESDIIGSLELDRLVVLLPYADMKAGAHVKSRFEEALKYYDFKSKGIEIMIDQVCFPINGTDTTDLIKRALRIE
ncbi:MAG: GGDEF domain-containing protein [Desulfobacterales bacterium]|nr:GGDEF domain-containing protein [Desulfobacterales bacterium]